MARLSVVVPVYFNAPNLPETIPQLLALQSALGAHQLELVFVDDGSEDDSRQILLDWQRRFPTQIHVVALSRNFGSMAAIVAGLGVATGDCVGMIAADLQDPPELLLEMMRQWERGAKVVLAVRVDRDESAWQKLTSKVYYALMKRFALADYPAGGFDFFLIDRQVAREVHRINEKNTNVMSLLYWLGFSPVMLPYVRRARTRGVSRWTFSKKVKLFIDSFVAFSYLPIRALSLIGAGIAVLAFAYALFVLFAWYSKGIPVRGFAPIAILLAFASGVQMLMLGILGEYLWRTLDEARGRPQFVIDQHWPPSLPVADE
jgi:polyisoprenyl-phosphate glycosyltransferase